MKRKEKGITILGLSVLLFLVFLVAMPAIAAEQDDFVLGIYGNANEDDTIDMRDLTYVKLIFFGKKPETELADAKYDGKINPLDFIQIKLIIVEKEKELTIVDSADRIVTVKKPVERVVLASGCPEAMRIANAADKVVGIQKIIPSKLESYFPEFSKVPVIGTYHNPDPETILDLRPDMVLATKGGVTPEKLEDKLPGLTVVRLDHRALLNAEAYMKLGYIFGTEGETKDFIDHCNSIIDMFKARTEGLSDDEKPKVYMAWYYSFDKTFGKGTIGDDMCKLAGGFNIAENVPGGDGHGYPTVDVEWILSENPDVITRTTSQGHPFQGYGVDDLSDMKEFRDEWLSSLGWKDLEAVKNDRAYIISSDLVGGPHSIVGAAYMAKWFHPKLFEDIDPRGIHQEYLTLQRFDYNVYEHGAWVYPPLKD